MVLKAREQKTTIRLLQCFLLASYIQKASSRQPRQRPTFLRLANERNFDAICQMIADPTTPKDWLPWKERPLHALCLLQPNVPVVRAVLQYLSRHHPNPAIQMDTIGRTPLHVAVHHGASLAVLQELMAGVSMRDHAGRYPLHWACASNKSRESRRRKKGIENSVRTVNALLEAYPVAATAKNHQSKTPLDLALQSKRSAVGIISSLRFAIQIMNKAPTKPDDHSECSTKETVSTVEESTKFAPKILNKPSSMFSIEEDDFDLSTVGSWSVSQSQHPVTRICFSPSERVGI